MKILIVTQTIDKNDPLLGFMHAWISAFARDCEKVTAVGLSVGETDLPKNVTVLSLGKEKGLSRLGYVFRLWKYSILFRNKYDVVFAHMNPEYVLAGAFLWKVLGKKITLWYAHGATSFKLWLTEKLVDMIFTSTSLGFRLKSDKVRIVGQGIDTSLFSFRRDVSKSEPYQIVSIGRLAPVKDYETLLYAGKMLQEKGISFSISIIGAAALPEHNAYGGYIRQLAEDLDLKQSVFFLGALPQDKVALQLEKAHVLVNTSHTGSLDKVIVEAMATGVPVITCNESAFEAFGRYKKQLSFPKKDRKALFSALSSLFDLSEQKYRLLCMHMRSQAEKHHTLPALISKIVNHLHGLQK